MPRIFENRSSDPVSRSISRRINFEWAEAASVVGDSVLSLLVGGEDMRGGGLRPVGSSAVSIRANTEILILTSLPIDHCRALQSSEESLVREREICWR